MTAFKKQHTFAKRKSEVDEILEKYPDRAPIICERQGTNIPSLDKHKYLVPLDFTVSQFIHIIRKRLTLSPEKAIFLLINNQLPRGNDLISTIYQDHKSRDGFLYISYSGENTFG